MYARPLMWNVPHWAEITLYAMIPLVLIAIAAGIAWRARKWLLGTAEPGESWLSGLRWNVLNGQRLVEFSKNAFLQWRLSRDGFATLMHLAIFWGMVVLALGTALATVDQDFTNLPFDFQILQGKSYLLFELALDLFGIVLIVGLAMAAYRRYVTRPERLVPKVAPISKWDTFPFLGFLFLVAVTGFLAEGLRLAEGFQIEDRLETASGSEVERLAVLEDLGMEERFHLIGEERRQDELERIAADASVFPAAAWAPVGYALGRLFAPLSAESIGLLHQAIWWAHALLAFGFMVCIPFTKAFHLISSPVNMLFRPAAPAGRLTVAAESGVSNIRQFTWRQLLQIDSCTWCGKCQEVCPASDSSFPLSPRDVVQKLDAHLVRARFKSDGADAAETLHGDVIAADELWSCVTCRACEDVCPVCIEHPRLLVDMRRHLVDQGEIDEGLQDALMAIQRYGNSFGQSARKRAQWAKDLESPPKDARKEEVEYLWFVGDYASYDQRVQPVTRAVADIFERAGLNFGTVMEKEQNSGNDVRRVGEEGLFDLLREKNCQALETASFQKVVTTDPHSYNTLKHEYAPGGNGENGSPMAGKTVLHYSELLDLLFGEGKLRPEKQLGYTATYHDPCYLGRYNGVYDAPRRVLAAVGVTLVEMPRNRENSFCCGGGGGRIWMKDMPGVHERPAEKRIKEALALPGVGYFVVACPKDLAMFQDAVKTVGAEDRLRVVDLGELVLEALEGKTVAEAQS